MIYNNNNSFELVWSLKPNRANFRWTLNDEECMLADMQRTNNLNNIVNYVIRKSASRLVAFSISDALAGRGILSYEHRMCCLVVMRGRRSTDATATAAAAALQAQHCATSVNAYVFISHRICCRALKRCGESLQVVK